MNKFWTMMMAAMVAASMAAYAQEEPVAISVSGMVRDKNGMGISGSVVTLAGPSSGTVKVDGSGKYEFVELLEGGNYTISVERKLYAFAPQKLELKKVSGAVPGQDFVGTPEGPTYSIKGFVMNDRREGCKAAIVTLSGELEASVASTCSGDYMFLDLPKGNYTVSARADGYKFSPAKRDYSPLDMDLEKQNFVGKTSLKVDPENDLNLRAVLKNIRAEGWGEYRSAGKCLCCDNILDGDCIIIGNVERTEKLKAPQVLDGDRGPSLDNDQGYFGSLLRRDDKKFVAELYLRITLPKAKDISSVVVWTQLKDGKTLLNNCELGYVDRFDRIQWVSKQENNRTSEFLQFLLKDPVNTKQVLLRVEDGRNRITEVDLYTRE